MADVRLIDANELFLPDENSDKVLILGGRCGGGKTVALAIELLKKKVREAPTIDPEDSRPQGWWRKRKNERACSNCEFIYYSNNDEWNYCPHCGAKMEVKER